MTKINKLTVINVSEHKNIAFDARLERRTQIQFKMLEVNRELAVICGILAKSYTLNRKHSHTSTRTLVRAPQ